MASKSPQDTLSAAAAGISKVSKTSSIPQDSLQHRGQPYGAVFQIFTDFKTYSGEFVANFHKLFDSQNMAMGPMTCWRPSKVSAPWFRWFQTSSAAKTKRLTSFSLDMALVSNTSLAFQDLISGFKTHFFHVRYGFADQNVAIDIY